MAQNIDRIKDTIRKMFDLAKDSGAFDGEINNAIKMARKMMNDHHLTEADLVDKGVSIEKDILSAQCDIFGANTVGGKTYGWEASLAMFVCKFVGGVKVYQERKQTRKNKAGFIVFKNEKPDTCSVFKFYGLIDDARFAQETYEYLSNLISTLAVAKYGTIFTGAGRDYSEGFVQGLNTHIKTADNEQSVSDSRALVVRRNEIVAAKERRAEIWLKQTHNLKLGAGGSRQTTYANRDYSARQDGMNDGRNTQIDGRKAQIGNQTRLLLGN